MYVECIALFSSELSTHIRCTWSSSVEAVRQWRRRLLPSNKRKYSYSNELPSLCAVGQLRQVWHHYPLEDFRANAATHAVIDSGGEGRSLRESHVTFEQGITSTSSQTQVDATAIPQVHTEKHQGIVLLLIISLGPHQNILMCYGVSVCPFVSPSTILLKKIGII